jgi:hypothetical protein
VCERIPHTCSVMQAAYSILHNMLSTSSTFDAASRNLDFINYSIFAGPPRPDNPNNRFPPSLHICYQVVGVKDVSEFLVHMCPNGCGHWWPQFVPAKEHNDCQGCGDCQCPNCNAFRFVQHRGVFDAAFPIFYFPDVFVQFFLNRQWYDAVNEARKAKKAPWFSSAEYKRLEEFFTKIGMTSEVCPPSGGLLHCCESSTMAHKAVH